MSLADRIKAAPSTRKRELVDTPEWADLLEGDEVYARSLNALQRAAFMDGMTVTQGLHGPEGKINLASLLPHVTDLIVDKDGTPLFDLAEREMLCEDHPDVVGRVLTTAINLTNFDTDAAKN